MNLADDSGYPADWWNEHDVTALEPNVGGLAPSQDVSIEIRVLVDLVVPNDSHIPHGAAGSRPSRVVERVQHRRHRGNRVSTRPHHVAQNKDLDRAQLSKGHIDEGRRTPGAD